MEKLLEISWHIPDNKWIEHNFDIKNSVSGIIKQEIAIPLQNVINCIEFLMGHSSFQYN